jgi:hypothetical protein
MQTSKKLLAAAALLSLAACASGKNDKNDMGGPVVGVPLNMPDHFLVAASGFGKSSEPKAGEGCRNPMIDPRDRTLLDLRRSANGVGDYRVTAGQDAGLASGAKYGLTSQQLLRIDCATGKPIGIVAE